MILNIPPLENSSKKKIFPFAIVKTKHLKENGFDFVLKEFMKDFRILESEEGMLLDIPHRPGFRVHGTIVTLCADTKGAHEIGGFMSPSATKLCRLCEISRADIRNHPSSDNVFLRSRQSIDEQAQYMAENCPNGDPSTGIKGICPLNDSSFFILAKILFWIQCMTFLKE